MESGTPKHESSSKQSEITKIVREDIQEDGTITSDLRTHDEY